MQQPHSEKSRLAISIRRHCMQDLIHAVLINSPHAYMGLLVKAGHIVETQLNVTQKLLSSESDIVEFIQHRQAGLTDQQRSICGIYHSTHVSQANISLLTRLYQSTLGRAPEHCLLLDPDHLGRVDALLYRDIACKRGITLNMVEDEAA